MDHRIALGFVLLSAVLFGCSGVWGKALFHTDLTPVQVTGFRILVAGLCVAIFAGFRGANSFHVTKPQFLFLAGFSVMFTLVQLSFFVAVALTSVAVALTLHPGRGGRFLMRGHGYRRPPLVGAATNRASRSAGRIRIAVPSRAAGIVPSWTRARMVSTDTPQ